MAMQYEYTNDWQWESVLPIQSEIAVPEGSDIYYFVLFVPRLRINTVWGLTYYLTQNSELGYRSAKSPGPMTDGLYEGFYTIILDLPAYYKTGVIQRLKDNRLFEYVRYFKRRTRFGQDSYSQEGVNSVILEEYYDGN